MANAYILNQFPTTYGAAMSQIVEMLVRAGWTYQASGDGLAGYNATGKVFSGTGSGALGWNNAKAWARLRDPGGGREFIFQHDAAAGARIKFSAVAGFVGGTPSATVPPSATDERVLRGGGTDAAPTYGANYFDSTLLAGTVKFQGCAKDTAPYGFWVASARSSLGNANMALMMDPVVSVPEDPDPIVIYICGATANAFLVGGGFGSNGTMSASMFPAPGAAQAGVWAHMDAARSQFLYVQPAYYGTGNDNDGNNHTPTGGSYPAGRVIGQGLPTVSPFNDRSDALPIPYLRPTVTGLAAPHGLKGWSTFARWTGCYRAPLLATMESKNWIAIGNVWLPWDGVTEPLH